MYRYLVLAAMLSTFVAYGQAPVITSFSPVSGPVGATVTINGSNFSLTAANNIVWFGGVKAAVLSATANTLTVTVPDGATPQPISVTANNLTTSSKTAFNMSFPGGSASFISSSFGPASNLTTGLYPYAVCAADLDGDGKPDLVSPGNANSPVSIISYLRNTGMTGSLSFAAEVDLPAPAGSFPYSMVTSDLDGDGRLDIVFTASTGSLCVYPNSSSSGTINFGVREDYATGTDPFSVAVSDLDGDGKPDIVVTNFLSNSISIYKNISTPGSIAFAAKIDLITALGPHTVTIADLDGDGKPDLAVSATFASAISLFRNQSSPGTLSFAARTDLATGSDEPFGLVAGDLDADGKPDLLVTYNNFNETKEATVSFSLFMNNSSPGSLAFGTMRNFGSGNSYNPTIGDLNGDGKPDIAVPTMDSGVLVYPNGSISGTITFGAPGKYIDISAYAVAISDLDGDHLPDMAVANFVSSTISFFKNATTAPGIASINPAIAIAGRKVTIVGVNLGSVTSVSFGGVPAASFTILSPTMITAIVGTGATGDVTLTSPIGTASFPGFTFTAPATITSISPAAAGSGSTVTINGTNLSGTAAVSFGGVPAASFSIVNDNLVTAVVGSGASGDVDLVIPGDTAILPGAFTFIAAPVITAFTPMAAANGATITITGSNFSGATAVTLGGTPVLSFTVNSATSITALVGGGSTGSLSVTTAGGTATLAGFTYISQPAPVIASFSPVSGKIGTTVTLTGSGFDPAGANDIVYFGAVRATVTTASATALIVTVPAGASLQPISVTTLGTHLTAYSATPFVVTFDTGAMQFSAPITYQSGYTDNSNIAAGDLDGDGKPDLVILDHFVVLRNTTTAIGNISFDVQQLSGGTSGNRAAVVADVDGDGKPDLVIVDYDTVYVLRNTSTPGMISFDTQVAFLTGYDSRDLAVADLDGDGRPELIVVNAFSNTVSILRNNCTAGVISFAAKADYPAGSSPSGVAIGDFDGDGKKDIAISSQNDNKVLVFTNQSTPGKILLDTPLSLTVDANPSSIVAGDLDGDGKADIATCSYTDNSFSVLRNQSTPYSLAFAGSVNFPNNYAVQAFSIRLAMADMDGDGKLDLALINQLSPGTATPFKNTSTPGNLVFTEARTNGLDVLITNKPVGGVIQDLDGDGRPDMAAVSMYGLLPGYVASGVSINRNESGEQPVIFAFSPTSGIDTSTITITGKNFDSASSVSFGGYPATSFTVISSTVITAVPPANSGGVVSVTTPKGTGTLNGFIYAAPPIVNQCTPINATTGETVTLLGDNFIGATGVSFGGTPAASWTLVNANTITAVVAAGSTGGISVTNPYGTGTLNGFTYLPVPTITSFTPTAGGPGTVVTITGTNFTDVTNVRFGLVEADTFMVVSPTTIKAVVGGGASGVVSVTNDGWSNNLPGFIFDPSVQINAQGPTNFCQGGTVVLQSSVSIGNQWYQNGAAIAGATADTLLVTASGTYTDQLNFPNLTTPSSSPVSITVNPIPVAPLITAAGNGLASSASSGNQWYQDTLTEIPGATTQIYVPADSGFYAVKVTLDGCTSAYSAPYFYHLPVTPPDTASATGLVLAEPNPVVGGRTQIKYSFPGITTLIAEVSDIQGHMLLLQPAFQSGGYIDLTRMSKGVYLLRLRDANGKTYGKISILKWN